ncbi:hypothetical protein OIU85_009327 [Salix viminalis]|uniref:Uncharacterized protein n=1 Tax=Salix viminalis TaxID=40686 RepID=A0A9Q0NZK0_SALVM|nr:hypothetical protein OIU85_009327 [Salix viminalis]
MNVMYVYTRVFRRWFHVCARAWRCWMRWRRRPGKKENPIMNSNNNKKAVDKRNLMDHRLPRCLLHQSHYQFIIN